MTFETLGAQLRSLREQLDLTITAVAEKAHLTRNTVRHLEGDRGLFANAQRYADALGADIKVVGSFPPQDAWSVTAISRRANVGLKTVNDALSAIYEDNMGPERIVLLQTVLTLLGAHLVLVRQWGVNR